MPEIGEVARIVHYLRKHLAQKTISSVSVQEDTIVYGKVGTSAEAFKAAVTGKKVLDAKQQGKYFWLVMNEPPHPVMHLGMTGWIKFSNDDSSYYRKQDSSDQPEPWPPRFWKFILHTQDKDEIAFVDARRLARIRLIDAPGSDLRNHSPLKENGPDPVIDKDILTPDWLTQKLTSKRVPIKALLLDQANISGIGNWVADEILYQSRIHPEQYSNTFSTAQIKELHKAMMHVCDTACGTLADSEKFPENWLMRYRWDMGKKGKNVLPNGDKIVHLKVGGRTSAVVPRVQKKTGRVAGDVGEGEEEESSEEASAASSSGEEAGEVKKAKGKRAAKAKVDKKPQPKTEEKEEAEPRPKRARASKAQQETQLKSEEPDETEEPQPKRTRTTKAKTDATSKVKKEDAEAASTAKARGGKAAKQTNGKTDKKENVGKKSKSTAKKEDTALEGRRRSGRLSGQGV